MQVPVVRYFTVAVLELSLYLLYQWPLLLCVTASYELSFVNLTLSPSFSSVSMTFYDPNTPFQFFFFMNPTHFLFL